MNKLAELLQEETRQKARASRSGMTRHSRFGTTVTVKAVSLLGPRMGNDADSAQGDQKLVLHKQNAITVNAGKILDDVKRKRAGKLKKAVGRPVFEV
jgi:replication fork protection complex subunit Tof1/Swi1